RRHTRFSRDWSSDVCSSDLPDADAAAHDWAGRMGVGPFFVYPVPIPFQVLKIWGEPVSAQVHKRVLMGYTGPVQIELIEPTDARSEERRVGEGWRGRRATRR